MKDDLRAVLNKHHSQQMRGRAGGAVMCICGQGCGGTRACAEYRGLIDELTQLREENERLRNLLNEVLNDHARPDSGFYNQCDESPCNWCERAIGAAK